MTGAEIDALRRCTQRGRPDASDPWLEETAKHLHIEATPEPKRRKAKPERVKVEIHKPKVDPECERLRREHEKRVREWKAMMGR